MTYARKDRQPPPENSRAPEPPAARGVCPLLIEVAETLNEAEVPYCYWKSTSKLDSVLAGESDLDLLVPRRGREALYDVMQAHGFKVWPDAPTLNQPEFVSFLGYDELAGLILHVHVHFRLMLGDTLAKAFHIPIEEALVARSVRHAQGALKVLDPLDEEIILRLRRALEGGALDFPAWRRRGAQRKTFKPPADAEALIARARDFLSEPAAACIANADFSEPRAKAALRRALADDLRFWRASGRLSCWARLARRTFYLALASLDRKRLRLARFGRRRGPGGGVLIAFVGVDGSGKSTQVAQTRAWLAREIDVASVYFGTGDGPASLLFRPLKRLAGMIGARIKVKPKGASHGQVSDRPPGPLYSLLFGAWALAVALDKQTKLAFARRAVARGYVVVADRYPQNEDPGFNDGLLLPRLPHAPEWLRRIERNIYQRAERTPPDLLIKLHVGPATVARREPDMRPELIAARIEGLKRLSCNGAKSVSIDASQPLSEVTRLVRQTIWRAL